MCADRKAAATALLDYDRRFTMSRGTLLAVGASGMAQGVSSRPSRARCKLPTRPAQSRCWTHPATRCFPSTRWARIRAWSYTPIFWKTGRAIPYARAAATNRRHEHGGFLRRRIWRRQAVEEDFITKRSAHAAPFCHAFESAVKICVARRAFNFPAPARQAQRGYAPAASRPRA